MVTHRIIFTSALAGSLLFYILYAYPFSWYLLVLIILLLPFDLLISLPGMMTRRVHFSAPMALAKNDNGYLSVVTQQTGRFPARCIRTRLRVKCDGQSARKSLECGGDGGSRLDVKIDTSRTGLTVFEIKRLWVVSLLGLFKVPAPVKCRAAVLILPAPVRPQNTLSLPLATVLRPKPGGGFSEDHDLRQYRQGDPIRSIHWKVSAKHDSLIIREPLVPPVHSRLVRVMRWDGPSERDLILARLLWISDYLLKLDLSYYIKLGDDGPINEITQAEDLKIYLFHVLGGMPQALPALVTHPARFSWEFRIDAIEDME